MKKSLTILTLSAILGLSYPSYLIAQTSIEQTEELSDKIKMPIWPSVKTELKEKEVIPVSFKPGQIKDISPSLLENVTFKGFARKVVAEGEEIGQVVATSVTKDEKEVIISQTGLSTQFDATDIDSLEKEKAIEVEGSKAELLTALKSLNSSDDEKAEETNDEELQESETGNIGSSGNDQASSYSSPEPLDIAKNSNETTNLTTQGCKVRIDEAQGVAIVQNKMQTFVDGALSSEGECSDSSTRYTIKQSSCKNKVDEASMKAYPQTRSYYVNGEGQTVEVSACAPDKDNFFNLKEDVTACTPSIDFDEEKVSFNTSLIYKNESGEIVQAKTCSPSKTIEDVELQTSLEACSMKHDYANEISYEMAMKFYKKDGQSYQVTACAETGREFPQEKIYGECAPIVANGKATLQYKRQIKVDGATQYITACIPDEESREVKATTEGCQIRHDVGAGISYQQEKFYYLDENDSMKFVTDCIDSDVTYKHDYEIAGWDNHDDKKFSYPKMKITIDTPDGTKTIEESVVLPGATQVSYVFEKEDEAPTGEPRYEGCNEFQDTVLSEIYERPDATFYNFPTGAPGDPIGPRDVCEETFQTRTFNKGQFDPSGYTAQVETGNDKWFCNSLNCSCGYVSDFWLDHPPGGGFATQVPISGNVIFGQLVTEQRVKKTNPNTGESFYTSPQEVGYQNDCSHVGSVSASVHSVSPEFSGQICGQSAWGNSTKPNNAQIYKCNYSSWR